MSSGAVQLAAVGLQDEFLTGNPDVTYFIKRFTRHTKFALEVLSVQFEKNDINFGSMCAVNIPRNGQLIRSMYLRLVLPPISNAVPNSTVGCYTDSIGHAIIEYADLLIGGQTIERISGEYMHIYSQSFISDSQELAMTYTVGDTSVTDTQTQYRSNQVYGLGPAIGYSDSVDVPEYGWYPRTFMVPLPFYFTRSDALSIPLVALSKQEVRVQIKLRSFDKVLAGGGSSLIPNSTEVVWTSNTISVTKIIKTAKYVVSTVVPSSSLSDWQTYFSGLIALPGPGDTITATTTGDISSIGILRPTVNTITWLPSSSTIAMYNRSVPSVAFYDINGEPSELPVSCISICENNSSLVVACGLGTLCYSTSGFFGPYTSVSTAINYQCVVSDGTNFLLVGLNGHAYMTYYDGVTYTHYSFPTINNFTSVSWSSGLQSFVVSGDGPTMYTFTYLNGLSPIGSGEYGAYSSTFGELYSQTPITALSTVASNVTSTTFDGINWVSLPNTSAPPSGTTWLTHNGSVMYAIRPGWISIGTPVSGTGTTVINEPIGALQASLAVEYVFLADEEINYIKKSKIDYVITQLQRFEVVIPPSVTVLNGARLNFINPVKEMFFLIQDSNVLATNDYFNFYNTFTKGDQLVNLNLQLNGEDIISDTVASALYMRQIQFLQNHTRLPNPNMAIYNYSWSIDPENYLPTGQINMSRVQNQNLWLNLTPSPNQRIVRVYAKSYNILRIQYGLGGNLFMDNNFY